MRFVSVSTAAPFGRASVIVVVVENSDAPAAKTDEEENGRIKLITDKLSRVKMNFLFLVFIN